jgi:pyruvate/2-oxoglutarate dehydrogenase complex dihydrolipoamide dehydrogenase (E3) component
MARTSGSVNVGVTGPDGGYPAAFLLDAAGRSVAVADPAGTLGGDCLTEGCVPSKAVRALAIQAGLTAATLAEAASPHPMISEGIVAAAGRMHQ